MKERNRRMLFAKNFPPFGRAVRTVRTREKQKVFPPESIGGEMHTKRASSSLSKSPAVFTTPLGAAVLWTRPFPFHAPTPKGRAGWEEENPVKDINNLVNKGPLLNGILPFLSLPPFVGQLPPSSSSPIEACRPGDRDLGAGREEEGEIAEREEEWGEKGKAK